jgi:hypothetical protein
MIYGTRITIFCIAVFFSLSLVGNADPVGELTQFQNETRADADQVNANFNTIKAAVDDNYARIDALSRPRSASVTYSAMGFTPSNNGIQFSKNLIGGSLSLTEGDPAGKQFFHCLTLRAGVTISRIRVHGNSVTCGLYKQGESLALATSEDLEDKNITIETFPASYFLVVTLVSLDHILYSVSIDYTYTEPAPEP